MKLGVGRQMDKQTGGPATDWSSAQTLKTKPTGRVLTYFRSNKAVLLHKSPSPETCAYVSARTHKQIHTSYSCLTSHLKKCRAGYVTFGKAMEDLEGRFWSCLTSQAVVCHYHCCWRFAVLLTAKLLINVSGMGIIVLVGWNVGRVCVWPGIAFLQCGSQSVAFLGEACVAVPPFACAHTVPRGCLQSCEALCWFYSPTLELLKTLIRRE